ncbi:MAG: holin, partial [Steroidobacteraceae bacterium]
DMHLTITFWRSAGERSIRAAASAMLALLGTGMLNILQIDWTGLLSVGLGAALVSFLTSIAASEIGDKGTTSIIRGGK